MPLQDYSYEKKQKSIFYSYEKKRDPLAYCPDCRDERDSRDMRDKLVKRRA
jgi:hypothetical protein